MDESAKPDRVLCVDDDPDTCEVLTVLLSLLGYVVISSTSPEEGLELIQFGGFALIILDNMFTHMPGVELCRRIRRFDGRTPVVFYSGAGLAKDQEAGIAAGAQAYVVKPDIGGLLQVVTRFMGRATPGG